MNLPLSSLYKANWLLLHRGALRRTVLPGTSLRKVTHEHLLLLQLGHSSTLHVCYVETAGWRDRFSFSCCFLGIRYPIDLVVVLFLLTLLLIVIPELLNWMTFRLFGCFYSDLLVDICEAMATAILHLRA